MFSYDPLGLCPEASDEMWPFFKTFNTMLKQAHGMSFGFQSKCECVCVCAGGDNQGLQKYSEGSVFLSFGSFPSIIIGSG